MLQNIIALVILLISLVACTLPGIMTVLGVGLALLSLIIASFSRGNGSTKMLALVIIFATFNLFFVSQMSTVVHKSLYINNQTGLEWFNQNILGDGDYQEKIAQARKQLEGVLGPSSYPSEELKERRLKNYWGSVKQILVIVCVPYLFAFFSLGMRLFNKP